MKRILFISSGMRMGGIERVLSEIMNQLSKDYNISLFCLERISPFYRIDSSITIRYCSKLFEVAYKMLRYIHNGLKKYFKVNLSLKLVAKWISAKIKFGDYDTVIFLPYSFFMCPFLIKENSESKNIMWMHNNFRVYFDDYYKYMSDELLKSLQISDVVISLTNEDKDGFGEYSNNVIKINNPLTLRNNGKRANLESKTISVTCRYAIEHKGLDYLVNVAKMIPQEWKIAVAGSGNSSEIRDFKSLIEKADVEDKFILRGAITGDNLQKHYQNSSIYVMTSRWEGLPLVLTEAMSFGLPIISFENSGANEILQGGSFGVIVEQGNVDKFSYQLNKMIENEELRKEYSCKSLRRVKDFECDHIVQQWKNIL